MYYNKFFLVPLLKIFEKKEDIKNYKLLHKQH